MSDCNEFRAEETFVRHRGTSSGYGAYCKVHHNVRVQASRLRNGGSRKYHLVRRYGVSEADMLEMVRRQAGLCPICRRSLGNKPHVDHDHATGEVRGLLCFTCNVGLGNYSDDVERLERAVAYLRGDLTAPSLVAPGVYEVDGHGWRRDEAVGSAG